MRNVVLVGGSSALSPEVSRALTAAGMATERLAGRDRYDTTRVLEATSVRLTVAGLTCGGTSAQVTIEGPLAPGSLYAPPQRTTIVSSAGRYEVVSLNAQFLNPLIYLRPLSGDWYGPFPAATIDTGAGVHTLQTVLDALLAEVGLAGSALVSAEPTAGGLLQTAVNGLTLTVGAEGLPTAGTSGGGTFTFSDWSNVADVTVPQAALRAAPPSLPPLCALPLP